MADAELTVTIKFNSSEVEPTEVDDAVTHVIEELEIIRDATITLAYSFKYHGVVQR